MEKNLHYTNISISIISNFVVLIAISLLLVIFLKLGFVEKLYISIISLLFVEMGEEPETGGNTYKKNEWLESFDVEDALLTLLYAQKDKPMTGKLMFVKQIFLLSNEVIPELKEKFKFFPYSFGPYSQIFAKAINKLIDEKTILVEVTQIEENVLYRFCLSDDGKVKAEQSFNKLPDDLKEIIIRKRRGWDQLGYTGMVRLVYTKYPEFIIASKIKDEVNE